MSRLIDADDLQKGKRKMHSSDWSGDFWDYAVLIEDIDNAPTVDAVPVEIYKNVYDELQKLKYKYRNVDDDDVWKCNMKALR